MEKRAHILQHVPFEGPGRIANWLQERGWSITTTRFYQNEIPPSQESFDFLVIMGGPMSVHDIAEHPWLVEEKIFVAQAIAAEKKVLGICLGAQILAEALGAHVRKNTEKEIGWFPLEKIAGNHPLAQQLPATLTAFHWHGETFSLPSKAISLYCSAVCKNQAFLWKERALGLQFHLEMTPAGIADLIHHCTSDLTPGEFVQKPSELLRHSPHRRHCDHALDQILSYLITP